ncbi:TerD family protein [Streptomyces sp. NPDC058374]|uniref:TerD family protein n=1 Tax=unclassified Streptomyces TaxID=2593676 RepID=UPI00364CEFE1
MTRWGFRRREGPQGYVTGGRTAMSTPNKNLGTIEIRLKWDPSPLGETAHDLDLIAAVFSSDDPHGSPDHLVHFDARSPDGTIHLQRESRTGQGLGFDEVMSLEFERMSQRLDRIVIGVAIQQRTGEKTFAGIPRTEAEIVEEYDTLATYDFAEVGEATAATIAVFRRNESGTWQLRRAVQGFADADPDAFAQLMGGVSV